jgi:NAD(P)H-hydrate repair Nnr-like enzyme with NAD(P)H-hydrate epimerase domain
MESIKSFKLEAGQTFQGLTASQYQKLLKDQETLGMSTEQLVEAAAFSTAMVLRVSLGLSASGASVTALIDDSLSGMIATATLRILANAGSNTSLLGLPDLTKVSSSLNKQLEIADKTGVEIAQVTESQITDTINHIADCHAIIFGLYNGKSIDMTNKLVAGINEIQTPVHVIEAPPGINVDTGKREGTAIFAATTITYGLPLIGLAEANEFCGRTYLCDISIPRKIYEAHSANLSKLFEAQPVCQIFPAK